LGNHFQITHEVADRAAELGTEDQPGEWPSLANPLLRQRLESQVLREDDAPKTAPALKDLRVGHLIRTIVRRRQHVHTPAPQLFR
jgi:hypothetical protein